MGLVSINFSMIGPYPGGGGGSGKWGVGGGVVWQRGLEPTLHDRPIQSISLVKNIDGGQKVH